jgi:NADH:ubiquinone oxidoreductase subunit
MANVSIFGVLSNVSMLLHTLMYGKKMGEDHLGNVYYRGKPRRGQKRERRWVMYKDKAEASLVPAQWHGWLHHQTDHLPDESTQYRKDWQKPHLPNMTGTDAAYLPPGHALNPGPRAASTADYTAWEPPK